MAFNLHSLRWKLFLAIGLPLFIIYFLVLATVYVELRNDAYEDVHLYMTGQALAYAEKFNEAFLVAEEVTQTAAHFLTSDTSLTKETLYALLRKNISLHPILYGSTVAYAEGAFSESPRLFAPYVWRGPKAVSASDFLQMDLYNNGDYRDEDWFEIPRETRKPFWTEPYFDSGAGETLMCTYSVPLLRQGKFLGVVTADIQISQLKDLIGHDGVLKENSFVIISRDGKYISHPDPSKILKETMLSQTDRVRRPDLAALSRKMIAGERGVSLIEDFRKPGKAFVFYAPVKSTGWSFAAIIPEKEIMGPVWKRLFKFEAVMLGGFFLILLLLWMVSSKITRPTVRLAQAAQKIGSGNFELSLKSYFGKDEIGQLAKAFENMTEDLKKHIAALTHETALRQQVESELELARSIQLSLLPKKFPRHKDFDLYGKNDPARYVAGDYFDFFFVDQNRLAFMIADVSGKGIPAAMFMVITRTLIHSLATKNRPPSEVLQEINQTLFKENDNGTFVTMFFGYHEITKGEVEYANAGHYEPFCIDTNGDIRKFGVVTGVPLGISDTSVYDNKTEILKPGETLVLFTDGFLEARTPSGQFLSEEGFKKVLSGYSRHPVPDFCEKVFHEATHFQEHKLSDDLTLLILRRFPTSA